jgi:pyruvate kinase
MKTKRTKIVATIGPATSEKEKIKELIESGMNVARINFSHGDYDSNGKLIRNIKELREEMNLPIGIIADLQGPRIRTAVKKEIKIEKGEKVLISDISIKSKLPSGEKKIIGLDWPGIIKDIQVGNEILIEDGLLGVKVLKKEKNYLEAEVINGGVVKNHKGVNIPDAKLKVGAVTKKDERDLKFALSQDVDFIALSFVSNAKEIFAVKKKIEKMLKGKKQPPQIVSKIERKEAIKNISEIIKATDVVMVARGDLGIEMEESRVIIYQKEIIAKCLRLAKPVIVATQMLDSMINNPRPTRAEVSDVSNAVIDHTDAVMLSGETANGKYPQRAVGVMSEIIYNVEKSPLDDLESQLLGDEKKISSIAVVHSAQELSRNTRAKAILVASTSGFTARMISRYRPEKKIFVVTNSKKTFEQLSLVWGVESFFIPGFKNLDELAKNSLEIIKKRKILKSKDRVVVLTGRPHKLKKNMNSVRLEEII